MNTLVLFDFDGTVTDRDTLLEIVKFHRGTVAFWFGMVLLSPVLILFKLGVIPNYRAKEAYLRYFFGGLPYDGFQRMCDEFSLKEIPKLVRPEAQKRLEWHREQGHRIVVVSASAENWLRKWCDFHRVELLSTELEVVDGIVTGRLHGINCHGAEKVKRVKAFLDASAFEEIYAYGDSSGDKELLEMATVKNYRVF